MNYYKIVLPISLNRYFTYKTKEYLEKGCRVHVSFGNTFHTGIVWEEDEEIEDIEYKNIPEIIDNNSLLSDELLHLAEWISKYYFCSLGQVLSSMLPSGFNVSLLLSIKRTRKEGKISDATATAILQEISNNEKINIKELRKKIKSSKFWFWIEKLEDEKFIETFRT